MTNYPLTIEEFRKWLGSKEEEEIVGWQGWCKGCPIFKCLRDNKGLEVISVNGKTTNINYELLDNPSWVENFISKVDCLAISLKQGEINASITAKEALEVLEEIENDLLN